ncbi:hypothetical protein BV914_09245 [Neisseria dumasiana]|nr:hypothetical protein BV914_09245 [Neisseria dumasiana]
MLFFLWWFPAGIIKASGRLKRGFQTALYIVDQLKNSTFVILGLDPSILSFSKFGRYSGQARV